MFHLSLFIHLLSQVKTVQRKWGLLLDLKPMEFVKVLTAKQMKLRGSLKIAFTHNINFEKKHILKKTFTTQSQMADLAICHTLTFCAITLITKKITAGRKITARGKSSGRKNESKLAFKST